MASSSSNITGPEGGSGVTVSQDEFNQFHKIDRNLYTLLVVGLGQEPGEATQVMAYFIWLERMSKDFRLVSKLLMKWPHTLLRDLVNEAVLALNCIERDHFPYSNNFNIELPLTQSITQSSVTLHYLHENRFTIIGAVTKIINDVCLRAFTDIVQRVQREKAMKEQNQHNLINNIAGNYYNNPYSFVNEVIYYNPAPSFGVLPQYTGVPQKVNEASTVNAWSGGGFDPLDNEELNKMLNRLELNIGDERKELPPDERTIFLTFSKGYPISEAEVRDYFSRRYGDIIEAVYMQEVQFLEQPLYARLVVRSVAMNLIDIILESTGKVKFTINGKHVCARKYTRKSTKSPQQTSPATSPSASPSAATSNW